PGQACDPGRGPAPGRPAGGRGWRRGPLPRGGAEAGRAAAQPPSALFTPRLPVPRPSPGPCRARGVVPGLPPPTAFTGFRTPVPASRHRRRPPPGRTDARVGARTPVTTPNHRPRPPHVGPGGALRVVDVVRPRGRRGPADRPRARGGGGGRPP